MKKEGALIPKTIHIFDTKILGTFEEEQLVVYE